MNKQIIYLGIGIAIIFYAFFSGFSFNNFQSFTFRGYTAIFLGLLFICLGLPDKWFIKLKGGKKKNE